MSKVRTAVYDALKTRDLGHPLKQEFSSYWPALTTQIANARNDAGHPERLERLSPEDVHFALSAFSSVAKMVRDVTEWVNQKYGQG